MVNYNTYSLERKIEDNGILIEKLQSENLRLKVRVENLEEKVKQFFMLWFTEPDAPLPVRSSIQAREFYKKFGGH